MKRKNKEEERYIDNCKYQIGHLSSFPILSKSPIAMSQTQTLARTTQLVQGTKFLLLTFVLNLKARAFTRQIRFYP